MKIFAKTVNGWLPLFSQKISIIDVWLGSKYFRRFYLLPSLDQAKSPSSRKMTRLVCSMIALEYESNNSQMTNTTNTWIGLFIVHLILEMYHLTALKVSKHGDFWSVLSRIRTEYGEIRSIQSECEKTRTRKKPIFGHFSRSVSYEYSEAYQASKMKNFAKIVNGFQ